jgi:hypothetical protein
MADLVRVSGTRQVTPAGSSSISTPSGNVILDSTSTIATGDLTVSNDLFVLDSAKIARKIITSDTSRADEEIVIKEEHTANVDNPFNIEYNPLDVFNAPYGDTGAIEEQKNLRKKGSAYFPGGVGIEKDLNVGGRIYGRITYSVTSTQIIVTATNVDAVFYPTFVRTLELSGIPLQADNTGTFAGGGLTYNPGRGLLTVEKINVTATTSATDVKSGALTVAGGVGIDGDLHVDDIYTKFVRSVYDKLVLEPAEQDPFVEIQGDIRVMGKRPIGTAPVVTNVLYVTMDGDDTNDGRAMDPSRACRTVGGAINSPFYQPGTQILVSAGHYLEDNPLRMKPYTSVRGSDIRTTFIEPINKTQDLFHLDSGCYLNYMTFLNGRSGLIEGSYAQGFNRGAYATCFPPLEGDERIDVFQSPYVQNCTNQSGPWLKDGTMFVPNQTVQLPLAVGMGSWPANTTTIVVTVSTGTIEQGMHINPGQQNPGFFNARTLMLANKRFMQEQVVAYVDATFNSGSFTYDSGKCYRDTGLIVDSIALDLLYNSTSESVFAGLQYWDQSGSAIPGEETTTTNAISYLKTLANATILAEGGSGGDASASNTLFDTITGIITGGTAGVTDAIVSNGNRSGVSSTNLAYEALIDAIPTYQTQVINWITTNHPSFVYDTVTCARDVRYIVESVAFDLLHGGNKQSIKSGVYYYGYDETSTQIPNEVPQVTAAYNFIKSIVPNIVKSELIINPQQVGVNQTTSTNFASDIEAEILQNNIDIITNIIRNGPDEVTVKTPINLTSSTLSSFKNAYDLLIANRSFIQAEVIAYIDSQFNYFDYSREYCYRDVGIIVENISYDAAFGGNQKSIESGLAYYDGVISKIAGQETQTISAIDYLNQMTQAIITNNTWTTILSVPASVAPTGTSTQVINTALTGGSIAAESFDNLYNIVTDIIANGPDIAPANYTSTGPDAAFISAEILMQANKAFIQEDTVNYINKLVKDFPYNKMKCKRDTRLILDSISLDLVFPTASRSQSTFAGVQYWNQSNYTGDIPNEIKQTVSTFSYLKDLAGKVILNITPADDLVDRYQNTTPQITDLESATSTEVALLRSEFNLFLDILEKGNAGWTDKILSNGVQPNPLKGIQNAYALLRANKQYMIDESIAYIEAMNPGFNYGGTGNKDKCKRDIGYVIDSIAFDLLYSGNRQIIQAGLSYYGINSTQSTIYGQTGQTQAAFNRIANILPSIVTNNPVVTSPGVTKTQVTSLPPASINEATNLILSIFTITNIIENGTSVALPLTSIAMTASNTVTSFYAFDIINANKDFIVDEVICYIDSIYNQDSFQYNEELCYRDVGLIIDAVSQDIILGGNQKSIEAGNAYWNKGYNYVVNQTYTTTVAINYARDLALQVIANKPVTPQTQTNAVQIINPFFQYGGDFMPQEAVKRNFAIITDIINRGPEYAPPVYAGGGLFALTGLSVDQVQISPQVTSVTTSTYNETLCRRDSGYIIDGVYFDVALGTNYNSVTAGNAYRRGTTSAKEVISNELSQTTKAISFLKSSTETLMAGSDTSILRANNSYNDLLSVLKGDTHPAITFSNPTGGNVYAIAAKDQLAANREFIKAETVAWINTQISGNTGIWANFNYDPIRCARDVGYLVDALCYDLLYGGNTAVRQCAFAYFDLDGKSVIPAESGQTAQAFAHMSVIARQIINGNTVTPSPGTMGTQVILPNVASFVEEIALNELVLIVNNAITAGNTLSIPAAINPSISWASAEIRTAVGSLSSGKTTLINNTISYVNTLFANTYVVGLSTATIGFGTNATLYFGDVYSIPLQDKNVPDEWQQRRLDPIGAMGGSLVDGAVISARSPIQSFVYDAFTQLPQGGRGVHIKNDGYAQLVSVFTIFCSVGVEVESGGIASIVNSNANFGDICLVARGYGKRKFSGTIYNPPFKSYPPSPGPEGFDQYYPTGFWPNNARVQVFTPDIDDRPHISLVMEVVPPDTVFDVLGNEVPQINDQGFPGFLNANPTLAKLTTGTITITDIDNTGVCIGNTVYIRDQNNSLIGDNGKMYADTGTVVTDLGYRSITLSKALTSGGVDPEFGEANTQWFNLYFCGNAYYTVLSSEVANNPYVTGTNILSIANTSTDQVSLHIDTLFYLNTLTNKVINNEDIAESVGNTATQYRNNLIATGGNASQFINLRFGEMINIIGAANLAAAEAVVPDRLRTKTGAITPGASDAIILISNNIDYLAEEINAYVQANKPGGFNYSEYKCKRDVKITLQRLIYDLESGGRYNSVMVGLSYWARNGTHHIVSLGENVRRQDLFPDGSTVNFYQRSYMSATGYVFEYVGAGTNYGALPQVGRADPVQGKETVQLDSGKVFFTSTDQNGDFRIGPGLVISQATGVLSGRTFTKSLFANMTPFILAIEGGAI